MASKPSGSKPGKKPPKGSGTPPAATSASGSAGSPSGASSSSSSSSSSKSSSKSAKSSSSPSSLSRGQQAAVDVSSIANAVGLGFLILVIGGLVQPVVTTFVPQALSQFWVMLVALVAFSVAGVRAGMSSPKPPLYGAGSAVGSYVLVVPIQFLQASFDPLYAVYTVVGAAVIGALAALAAARFARSREG